VVVEEVGVTSVPRRMSRGRRVKCASVVLGAWTTVVREKQLRNTVVKVLAAVWFGWANYGQGQESGARIDDV
jgi:hypothetical protein